MHQFSEDLFLVFSFTYMKDTNAYSKTTKHKTKPEIFAYIQISNFFGLIRK